MIGTYHQNLFFLNVEIKARCPDLNRIQKILQSYNAVYRGTDRQIDTYFSVKEGRLKLREGNIENRLIYYQRHDQKGPKGSRGTLYTTQQNSTLKEILTESLGVLTVVEKKREIYFIDNVKIHLDNIDNLGTFVEIEAIDTDGAMGMEALTEQCRDFMGLFGISEEDLVETSYCDLTIESST